MLKAPPVFIVLFGVFSFLFKAPPVALVVVRGPLAAPLARDGVEAHLRSEWLGTMKKRERETDLRSQGVHVRHSGT